MSNKNHSGDSAQLSFFDILGLAGNIDDHYSSDEIEEVIGKLRAAKRIAEKHEENDRRRREKEEAERKAREEKERKDAHVREVTCMNLPLDWNNIFNCDVRTQGVHVESIPDALIMSLNTLGKVDSMKRQKQHKQRLLYELSHCTGYKPSIWRECKWDRELKKYVYSNRIKRGKRIGTQKCLKKASCRKVGHLQAEAFSPKGNHYRRVFDYWWTWI